jgi:hypothetical protein
MDGRGCQSVKQDSVKQDSMTPGRRNLVIVRAGNSSLHPAWLSGAPERSWDLLVNYFGDDPDKYKDQDILRIDSKGPKWPALKELIETHREIIDRYDYVWLPDDDIATNAADINRLFEIARKYKLALCQPALSLNSYFSWGVTLKTMFTRLRYTNFVEIMVPCFDHDFLLRCLPSMGDNLSGFGLDFLWPHMLASEPDRIAIIDAVSVTHTRPVGGPNYALLRERGISAEDEGLQVRRKHGVSDTNIYINRLETSARISVSGNSGLGKLLLSLGYRFVIARAYVLRKPNRWDLDRALRPQLVAPHRFASPWP